MSALLVAPPTTYVEDAAPGPAAPRLVGDGQVEVAVVGAGITGLSAALHLAEAGQRVAVLDTGEIGWGASGRNGGQVNPGLKPDPDAVVAAVGEARGERLVQAAWNAPDLVFELIDRHNIACDAARGGTLRAAVAIGDMHGLERLASQCRSRGMAVTILNAADTAARTGTGRYKAALHDPRGGQVNPLAYTRGLASAAAASGASIHGASGVQRLERSGAGWQLRGAAFNLKAANVVLATNGYTDGIWPNLARSIVPVFSAIVASEPLPRHIRQRILNQREVLYELGSITTYYRIDAGGRLLLGGRSRSRELSGAAAFPFLTRYAQLLWPELRGTRWSHGWNGQLALTTDHFPHWHEPAAGLFACLGYNGRGIAMATLLGRELARRIGGTSQADLLLPARAIQPLSFHRFWKVAVGTGILWGRMSDRVRVGAG